MENKKLYLVRAVAYDNSAGPAYYLTFGIFDSRDLAEDRIMKLGNNIEKKDGYYHSEEPIFNRFLEFFKCFDIYLYEFPLNPSIEHLRNMGWIYDGEEETGYDRH